MCGLTPYRYGALVNRRGVPDETIEGVRKHAAAHVRALHPAAAVSAELLRKHGFPRQLDFEPKDCVFLYVTPLKTKRGGL